MQSSVLVSSFAEIAHEKGIDRDTLQLIVEDVFRAMIKKRYGSDDSFEIILNPDHGDMQILHIREVVKDWDLHDPVTQIEYSDAIRTDPEFVVGDEVAEEIEFKDFGRRAVMTARQTFSQRIRDIEKENVFAWYQELVGEVIVGEIYQIRRREILVIHNKVELILPRSEQIYRDRYRKGDMIRAVIKEVSRDSAGNPQIIVSRADPLFMERLFELEVPEIDEGIVEIKQIVREPGERAKVAVISYDERIDPVGACVGMKGSRIHAVVRELGNENIDVVQWSDSKEELIKRALSPSNPFSIQINDDLDPPRAKVVVRADEVSQAIGRGGINIRLASMLTGYEIDVYREISDKEEDVEIGEFADEIDADTLQLLRDIGCDTARAVLELSKEELVRRTGLDVEIAAAVIDVIRSEFEEEDDGNKIELATPPVEGAEATVPKEDAELIDEKAESKEDSAADSDVKLDSEEDDASAKEETSESASEEGADESPETETADKASAESDPESPDSDDSEEAKADAGDAAKTDDSEEAKADSGDAAKADDSEEAKADDSEEVKADSGDAVKDEDSEETTADSGDAVKADDSEEAKAENSDETTADDTEGTENVDEESSSTENTEEEGEEKIEA
ncbi:MAG: transcription termination/antitermination protein NusA [Bacteroidetes bacterium]|nr:transcription termination/antitermination protein NusA [Bacteroidota bacterium]